MPVQRVLWHPRHSNKFVVGGGSQITLYTLSEEKPEIIHITSQHDLQYMKCFAWSPAYAPSDVFAVGHSSGRVDLLRLEASRYSENDILSSGPILSLPVRNQRSCNTLAFSSDPNYLAVGLDKVRGDGSLIIWDISEAMSVFRAAIGSVDQDVTTPYSTEPIGRFSTYPPIPRTDYPVRTDQRIVQAHAQTELISSLAWLPQSTHPYLLLAGISNRWLRLYDLRTPAGSGAISVAAGKVNGITTDPFDATRFASWGDGVITVWDARKLHSPRMRSDTNLSPSPTPILTFTEKDAGPEGAPSTLISPNPKSAMTPSTFTSSRPSGSAAAHTTPNSFVIQQPTYATAEFSPARRGMLATLTKDATYVRLWSILEAGNSSLRHEVEHIDENITKMKDKTSASRKSWANLPWSGSNASSESKGSSPVREERSKDHPGLLSYDTKKTFARNSSGPLSSFVIIPPIYSSHRTKSKVVVVTQAGEITVQSVYDVPQSLVWSSRGDMLYGPLEQVSKENQSSGFGIVNGSREDEEEKGTPNYALDLRGNPTSHAAPGPKELHKRGRARNPNESPSPVLFGRGDEDGFPALSRTSSTIPVSANLAATKPIDGLNGGEQKKERTFSPAAALRLPMGPTNAPSASTAKPYGESSTAMSHSSDKHKGMDPSSAAHVVANDISMVMRRRAIRGYSIRDPLRNALVIREVASGSGAHEETLRSIEYKRLADLWEWIYHSQNFLSSPTPLLHTYDFSFAGIWDIWDGPPSIGGSGTIPRYIDSLVANPTRSDTFDTVASVSTTTSGSVNSSFIGGSLSSSPRSTIGFGSGSLISENSIDSDATPVHRDRLELPSVQDPPLHHGFDRSRRAQGHSLISGSNGSRNQSPLPDPLTKDPEWRQALLSLFARTSESNSASAHPAFPYISTSRPLQRHLCLHLIGWGFVLRDESLMTEVRRWERGSDGDEGYARAAAWLVFSGRYGGNAGVSNEGTVHGEGAIECLLRSEDETHHMMSGVIAALVPFASATLTSSGSSSKLTLPSSLREHYERLINKLHNAYLRALLTHLTAISSLHAPSGEHWLEILHEEADLLPFHERLALAFCFLDDAALTTYLRRCREHALSKNGGDVDALVVTGLGTPEGKEVLALWLDRCGDIQSAALLGWTAINVSLGRNTTNKPVLGGIPAIDPRVNRWVESYRDFLDSVKLFHCRVEFDIERGETLQVALDRRTSIPRDSSTFAPKQILIRCNYCNKTVAPNNGQENDAKLGLGLDSSSKGKPTTCPNCGRSLPRCSICLMSLGIVQDALREAGLAQSHHQDTIDDAIVICQNCRHGGHASHILEWFFGSELDGQATLSRKFCAVADCNCQCANEF